MTEQMAFIVLKMVQNSRNNKSQGIPANEPPKKAFQTIYRTRHHRGVDRVVYCDDLDLQKAATEEGTGRNRHAR